MSEKDVEVLKRDVQKILAYLHNDTGTGKKGLVAEMSDLKHAFYQFIESYKIEKAVKNAKIGIIATIGAGLALLIEWIIKIVF